MPEQAAAATPYPPYPPYVMVPVRERNGLGVVGFLIALVGLVIPTGIVALLGLLISLVALGRAPRLFAGMGVITGLFGTVIWLALMILAVFGVLAAGAVAVVFGAGAFSRRIGREVRDVRSSSRSRSSSTVLPTAAIRDGADP